MTARVEAPGHDKAFDQKNEAKAKGHADASGVDADQQVSADAAATLERSSNTAVELRVESDGDSDGGTQSNTAAADAAVTSDDPDAATSANADAKVANPSNTFVSVRVNSDGTTGGVEQSTTTSEIETVNGVTAAETTSDHADGEWTSSDPSSGVDITLRSDGANTDLRVSVENDSLPLPSSAPTFVWTWDMAFGPEAPVSCDIQSAVTAEQVAWTSDAYRPVRRCALAAAGKRWRNETATSEGQTRRRGRAQVRVAGAIPVRPVSPALERTAPGRCRVARCASAAATGVAQPVRRS